MRDRTSAQRLALEFPGVSPGVINAAIAGARAQLRPNLSESLAEMTELVARQRIQLIAGSVADTTSV
ncbi:hypothetical protein ACLMAJ_29850 [Nocardia sp. KC 131]|uniref:hypothetical protein n=1 Tax=Nocardia arseniciresistens TaxID=3392119 RepID=UPI00398E8200